MQFTNTVIEKTKRKQSKRNKDLSDPRYVGNET